MFPAGILPVSAAMALAQLNPGSPLSDLEMLKGRSVGLRPGKRWGCSLTRLRGYANSGKRWKLGG